MLLHFTLYSPLTLQLHLHGNMLALLRIRNVRNLSEMAKEHPHDDSTERDEFRGTPCKEELMSLASGKRDAETKQSIKRSIREGERILLRCLYVNNTEPWIHHSQAFIFAMATVTHCAIGEWWRIDSRIEFVWPALQSLSSFLSSVLVHCHAAIKGLNMHPKIKMNRNVW